MPDFGVSILSAIIVSASAGAVAAGTATAIANVVVYGGMLAALAYQALNTSKPKVPKPEDGAYNLKQSVPQLSHVLGRAKKAGDYTLLESKGGYAHHVIVFAGHRCEGIVQHYLHDEAISLTGTQVTGPSHFSDKVHINHRLGLPLETAYESLTVDLPTIWTNAHRGDGLASVYMTCATVSQDDYLKTYPNQMPSWSAVIDGALLYDPRTDETAFSRNIALMRLWHLLHPSFGRLKLADIDLDSWRHAADICDQTIINRDGASERRYHGGLWFRSADDQVQVARLMDEAAQIVVYENAAGRIAVHAGEYVEPDITLTATDIISITDDTNTRRSKAVAAVRGRYTNPSTRYATADAAIWGDPYAGEDSERTKTVDNQIVQSHNHMQRLQKITMLRAQGRAVSVTFHRTPQTKRAKDRRYVRISYGPRLQDAILEITASPKTSLRAMTITVSGVLVPASLFDFDAATEEGAPGNTPVELVYEGVPPPENFTATVHQATLSGGATAAYIRGAWDYLSAALTYEMEWQPTAGGAARSVRSVAGESVVASEYLADGVEYRVRLRTWSVGTHSDWTDYQTLTAVADPVAPAEPVSVAASGGDDEIVYGWTAPNSANYRGVRIYQNTVDDLTSATLVATEYGAPNMTDSRTVTGLTADTYYGWIRAINASGIASDAVSTGPITVS